MQWYPVVKVTWIAIARFGDHEITKLTFTQFTRLFFRLGNHLYRVYAYAYDIDRCAPLCIAPCVNFTRTICEHLCWWFLLFPQLSYWTKDFTVNLINCVVKCEIIHANGKRSHSFLVDSVSNSNSNVQWNSKIDLTFCGGKWAFQFKNQFDRTIVYSTANSYRRSILLAVNRDMVA